MKGTSHLSSAITTQVWDQEDTTNRLKICPRRVLESLSDIRIEKSRIQPLADRVPKAGGLADVHAAILLPERPMHSPKPDLVEYVAVKKLRFEEEIDEDRVLAPFAHEINLLKDLSHENVVKIVGFVEDTKEGIAWMIFAWEKNGNLREFVRSADWELPERISLFQLLDVTQGLEYLHDRKPPICHGDLKSLNILVNAQRRAMITDFGSARAVHDPAREARGDRTMGMQGQRPTEDPMLSLKAEVAATGESITMTGPAWTVRWAAPELLGGELPGLASDVWAFGWICWECITGNFPFANENNTTVIVRIIRGDIPEVRDDSQLEQIKALCSIMMECWTLDAIKRPSVTQCRNLMSFLAWSVPSDRETNHLPSSHSCKLLLSLGLMHYKNGRMDEARRYFEQSSEIAKSVEDEEAHADAQHSLGEVYYSTGEYSRAENAYIVSRDSFFRIGDWIRAGQSIGGLADVYITQREYSKAEDEYTEALEAYPHLERRCVARFVMGLGEVSYLRGAYSKAEDAYIKARDILPEIDNQGSFTLAIRRLGSVYLEQGEYSKAEEAYAQACNIYIQNGNKVGLADSMEELGAVYRTQGEYSKAENMYTEAYEIYSQIGDLGGVAAIRQQLGVLYHIQNEYSKAEGAYNDAHDIYSRIGGRRGAAEAVQGLGELYWLQREYYKVEDAYTKARNIYYQIGDQLMWAELAHRLGVVYQARTEYPKAEAAFVEARDAFSRAHNQFRSALSSMALAWAYHAQNKFSEAERSYMTAREIYTQIGAMRSLVEASWTLSCLHRAHGRWREAEKFILEALAISRELGLEEEIAEYEEFLEEVRRLTKA
ncbi:hypothetical protein FS837_011765 [Tulasnella sp. UAMH 9824]|nr:hypothetical protein FS837_011765 [Tulasnella sp. UAMH 9824]